MTKSPKKRGRPPRRKSRQRPIVGARVPEEFFEQIKRGAQTAGRTVSEEMIWRARQAYEWEKVLAKLEDVRALLDRGRDMWKQSLRLGASVNFEQFWKDLENFRDEAERTLRDDLNQREIGTGLVLPTSDSERVIYKHIEKEFASEVKTLIKETIRQAQPVLLESLTLEQLGLNREMEKLASVLSVAITDGIKQAQPVPLESLTLEQLGLVKDVIKQALAEGIEAGDIWVAPAAPERKPK